MAVLANWVEFMKSFRAPVDQKAAQLRTSESTIHKTNKKLRDLISQFNQLEQFTETYKRCRLRDDRSSRGEIGPSDLIESEEPSDDELIHLAAKSYRAAALISQRIMDLPVEEHIVRRIKKKSRVMPYQHQAQNQFQAQKKRNPFVRESPADLPHLSLLESEAQTEKSEEMKMNELTFSMERTQIRSTTD